MSGVKVRVGVRVRVRGLGVLPVGDAARLHLVYDDHLLVTEDGGGQSHAQAGARRLGNLYKQRT